MEQKIIPTTPEDLAGLKAKIGIDQDEICLNCDSKLSKYVLKDGKIVYLCFECDNIWEKIKIDENHFKLAKSERLFII
ncbi:hypothetical protein GQ568_00150 [Patescibacteria group bacterium]|nr:hypothetical protein [Patescibacteria group bacterium]